MVEESDQLKGATIDQFEQIVYMAPGKRGNEVTIFSLFLHDRAEAFPVSTQCKFSWRNKKNSYLETPLIWSYVEVKITHKLYIELFCKVANI